MFDSGIEKTIICTAVVLWFATGWYLNYRLKHLHAKLDLVLNQFNGLRRYLYEIDPQFDDGKSLSEDSKKLRSKGKSGLSGLNLVQYFRQRKAEAKLNLEIAKDAQAIKEAIESLNKHK